MNTLQHALVGLTLSEADDNLLRYAAMLHTTGIVQRFEFVHVRSDYADPNPPNSVADIQARMKSLVESFLPADAIGGQTNTDSLLHAVVGAREDKIAELAGRTGIGLLLLGYRRNGRGKRSLARRLAMIAPVSVWMVPDNAPARITQVLAPIDFSSHSADSLSIACGVSGKAGLTECEALHVFFDASAIRFEDSFDHQRGQEQAEFERFVHPLETFGVRVQPVFDESSNVARAIVRVAAERQSDLIVMNTRGRSAAAAVLIGSETSQILMESPIPVLAVKHRGAHLNLLDVLTNPELWSRPSPHTN